MTLSAGCDITLLPYSIWDGSSAMPATVRILFQFDKIKNRTKRALFRNIRRFPAEARQSPDRSLRSLHILGWRAGSACFRQDILHLARELLEAEGLGEEVHIGRVGGDLEGGF